MNNLKLPQSRKQRQKAIEQILLQLVRKIKSENYRKLEKDQFFEKLKDYYETWPKNKAIRTRWGKIYDPLRFISEVEKERVNIDNLLLNLELPKKKKKQLMFLADVISDSYLLDNKELSDLDLILEKIKKQDNQSIATYVDENGEEYNSDRIIKELIELTNNARIYFLNQLRKLSYKKEKEWQMAKQLEYQLNKKGESYGIKTCIIDFARWAKNVYGVKIEIGTNVYLFDFEGTLEELKETLEKEIELIGQDIIECPFCKKSYQRQFIIDNPKCSCGTEFITESIFYMGERNVSFEIKDLWDEACQQTKLKKPKDWSHRHIDDYFENIYYLGKGTVGSRMWALKRPWVKKKKKAI
ncbi:MAG: hypothetical protein ACTSVB_04975 [Candidatus Heimdallarchaeaceae archaeon]|uniref:Uncharacterized protein n=1 Tax=Candidatus Heimdallarchaeum endolithica TaxID=2876572 RepID=A0A9Y1BQI5_9ARCH|nr:MAG: hypothetical protein K9W46_12090 [Candidatus Heimdallarchaeum endolithica]